MKRLRESSITKDDNIDEREERAGENEVNERNDDNEESPDFQIPADLPEELVPLWRAASQDPETSWTDLKLRLLARNFLGKPTEHGIWNSREASLRSELLLMRPVETENKKLKDFAETAASFEDLCSCPVPLPVDMVISADTLLTLVKKMQGKASSERKQEDIDALATEMKGVQAIDMQLSSPETAGAWLDFMDDCEIYVANHPKIKAIIDPVYVVIQLTPEAALGTNILAMPVAAPAPPLVQLNGSEHAWTFQNSRNASFWCAVLRNQSSLESLDVLVLNSCCALVRVTVEL